MAHNQTLLKAILKAKIYSLVIKNDNAYPMLYEQLQNALTSTWINNMRALLDHLHNRSANITELMNIIESHVGAQAMMQALYDSIQTLSEALYRLGIQEVQTSIPEIKKAVDFQHPDYNALKLTQQANLYWIGNSWNSFTDKLFRDALTDYFKQGYSRQQLMERFAQDFAGLTKRGQRYWELLADHTATRTREMGRVEAYQSADIQYVQVRAHLDARTSSICKKMHGKIIPVNRMVAQRNTYLKATSQRDMDAAKKAWHLWNESEDMSAINSDKLPSNTAMPPYHFRCRTITVAYFGDTDDEPAIAPARSILQIPEDQLTLPYVPQNVLEYTEQKLSPYSIAELQKIFLAQTRELEQKLTKYQDKIDQAWHKLAHQDLDGRTRRNVRTQMKRAERSYKEIIERSRTETCLIAQHLYQRKYSHIEWDLFGLDPRTLVPTLQELDKLATDYPKVFNTLRYIGNGRSGSQNARYVAQVLNQGIGIYADIYAFATPGIIALSPKYYSDYGKFLNSLHQGEVQNWQVSKRIEQIVTHEFGHIIDFHVHASMNWDFNNSFEKLTKSEIEQGLSRYAKTNILEFAAESFTELRHNPKPHEISKIFRVILRRNKELLKFLVKKLIKHIQHTINKT